MEKKWWTLVVVCAATFILLVDITIVIVALPTIQSELHASFSEVQWVIDAYALTLASVLLADGSLADRYSRHCFVWLSFSQTIDTVIAGFDAAWAFFGGVFQVIIPDNMGTVVTKADKLEPASTRRSWSAPKPGVS